MNHFHFIWNLSLLIYEVLVEKLIDEVEIWIGSEEMKFKKKESC